MTDQLKFTDLPPSESGYATSTEYKPKYSPQITHWPTLLAAAAGVVVLITLFSWFTGGSDHKSETATTKKPKTKYVAPARSHESYFDPNNPDAAHEYAKEYLDLN